MEDDFDLDDAVGKEVKLTVSVVQAAARRAAVKHRAAMHVCSDRPVRVQLALAQIPSIRRGE